MASPALKVCLCVLLLPAVTGQYQTHHRLGWGGAGAAVGLLFLNFSVSITSF